MLIMEKTSETSIHIGLQSRDKTVLYTSVCRKKF